MRWTRLQRRYSFLNPFRQLEELRNGPDWASEGSTSPALEYPDPPLLPVANGKEDEKKCYVLGWPEDEVFRRIIEVASPGQGVTHQRDPAFQATYARALRYMSQKANYFHIWTSYEYSAGDEGGVEMEEYAGPQLFAIGCSVQSAYDRRPSKAQFEWFKKVMEREPRWYLSDRSFYTMEVNDGLWGSHPCCPMVRDFSAGQDFEN